MTRRSALALATTALLLAVACNAILGNETISYVGGDGDAGGIDSSSGGDATPADATTTDAIGDAPTDVPLSRKELTTAITQPWYVAVASDDIVVTSSDGVYRVPKAGIGIVGPPAKLASRPTAGVALEGENVLFCDGNAGNGGLFRVPLDGGAIDEPFMSACSEVATSPNHVVFTEVRDAGVVELRDSGVVVLFTGALPTGIKTGDLALFFADPVAHAVGKIGLVPLASEFTLLVDGGAPRRLAIDATYVYYTQFESNLIMRVPKDGSSGPAQIAEGPGGVGYGGVAVDATHVYWTLSSAASSFGGLYTAPIGGGIGEKVEPLDNPIDVALDADYAYVTTQNPGRVLRIPKK